jgi:hypothetical protein
VPGTDPGETALTPESRADLVRRLTLAGWLLLGGSFGFIAFQYERVRDVGEQPFASVWDQRIEVLSFLMLPPNLVVLAPAAFVAAVATWLTGRNGGPWLTTLLRTVAAIAITLGVIGIVSIVSILVRDEAGPSDIAGVSLRMGGVSLAAGLALICRTADVTHGVRHDE